MPLSWPEFQVGFFYYFLYIPNQWMTNPALPSQAAKPGPMIRRISKIIAPLSMAKSFLLIFSCITTLQIFFPTYIECQQENYDQPWKWIKFTKESGLPSNHTLQFYEDSKGIPWVVTDKGLAWYDHFQWKVIDTTAGLPNKAGTFTFIGEFHESLLVSNSNQWYIGTTQGFRPLFFQDVQDIVPLSKNSLLVLRHNILYSYDGAQFQKFTPQIILDGRESIRLLSSRKSPWLQSNKKLFRLEDGRWKLKTILPSDHIVPFVEDKYGTGILALNGVAPYVVEWDAYSSLKLNKNEFGDLATSSDIGPTGDVIISNKNGAHRIRRHNTWTDCKGLQTYVQNITSVKFDEAGNLWVCSENGLYLYRNNIQRWTYMQHPGLDRRNKINEILFTRDGDMWVATDGGVEIVAANGHSTTLTQIGTSKITAVTSLGEDNEGNIWFGSGSAFKGVYRWNKKSWQYFSVTDDSDGIWVHKIRKDRHGRLWFLGLRNNYSMSVNQPGAYVFDRGTFTRWGKAEGLLSGRVYAFAEDTKGALWFGTFGGLNRWKNGQWKVWRSREAFPGARVVTICVDNNDRVFFSDQISGISYLDDHEQIQHLTTEDDLISNNVWGIVADSMNRLWITTVGGLSCYQDGMFSNFDARNGLANTFLWPLVVHGNKVYIGTIGSGLAILNLEEYNSPPPRVTVDRPRVEQNNAFVQWKALAYWGEPSPQDILTRYKIDDKDWSKWEIRNQTSLGELDPGPHALKVQAKGLFGNYDAEGSEATFSVPLPNYRQPAFLFPILIVIAGTIILSIVMLIRKRRDATLLKKSELKFRRLTEATFEGIVIHDHGVILDVNQIILKMFGYESAEIIGKSLLDFVAPEYRELVKKTITSGSERPDEVVAIIKNGSRIILEIIDRTIPYENRMARVAAIRDITARRQTEEQLINYQDQLRSLASELSKSEEKERRQMATYLHDTIGQALAFCKIKLGEAQKSGSYQDLDDIRSLIEETLQNAQSLTFELSPPVLYELSFEEAVEWLTERFQIQHHLRVTFEHDKTPIALEDDLRTVLFNAVRELLTNIVKHSKCTQASVQLHKEENNLIITVNDNGVGFDHGTRGRNRGFGLFNIRERITTLGGDLVINSQAGNGTRVTLKAPLKQEKAS